MSLHCCTICRFYVIWRFSQIPFMTNMTTVWQPPFSRGMFLSFACYVFACFRLWTSCEAIMSAWNYYWKLPTTRWFLTCSQSYKLLVQISAVMPHISSLLVSIHARASLQPIASVLTWSLECKVSLITDPVHKWNYHWAFQKLILWYYWLLCNHRVYSSGSLNFWW